MIHVRQKHPTPYCTITTDFVTPEQFAKDHPLSIMDWQYSYDCVAWHDFSELIKRNSDKVEKWLHDEIESDGLASTLAEIQEDDKLELPKLNCKIGEKHNVERKQNEEYDLDNLNAYADVIGIDGRGYVYGGFDQELDHACNEQKFDDQLNKEYFKECQLSADKRISIADQMIARWSEFKAVAESEAGIRCDGGFAILGEVEDAEKLAEWFRRDWGDFWQKMLNDSKAISAHCYGVTNCYPIMDGLGRPQEARFIKSLFVPPDHASEHRGR